MESLLKITLSPCAECDVLPLFVPIDNVPWFVTLWRAMGGCPGPWHRDGTIADWHRVKHLGLGARVGKIPLAVKRTLLC